MKVKEFLIDNEIITSALAVNFSYITEDGKNSINGKFEFELGDLLLFYEDPLKIHSAVNYLLVKNRLKYTEIDKTLKLAIPLEYQRKLTHAGTKKEDVLKTVGVIADTTTSESGTLTKEGGTTNSNTSDITNTLDTTGTVTNTLSEKITVGSKIGFEDATFKDTDKSIETKALPDTTGTISKDETVGKVIDSGSTTIDTSDTTERVVEIGVISDTTDTTGITGNESYTDTEESLEILDRLEQYKALYSVSLWDVIVEDIKKVICLSIWE